MTRRERRYYVTLTAMGAAGILYALAAGGVLAWWEVAAVGAVAALIWARLSRKF